MIYTCYNSSRERKMDRENNHNFKSQKEIYNFWQKLKIFPANSKTNKPKYSILLPPPNLTGELHLGHAMQHSILDAIARYKRLRGFDVLLLPGVDHAGIAFEETFDRELKKQNLSKTKLGMDQWLKKAWEFKDQIYKSVSVSWRMMGLCADWGREVFTLDEGPRQAVFHAFKTFYEDGFIYKGPYIVQWCPRCNTAIEDVEMEYEERKEKLYYVKYFLDQHPASGKSGTEHIVVATARTETIFADVAIAVHPASPFKKYVGRTAYIPVPLSPKGRQDHLGVIADERVDKNFGTGALKITPGHDALDYKIGLDNNLPIYHAVDKSGRMTELAGELKGLKVEEARVKAAELLGETYIEKTEEYIHSVPVCERCKTVIEPLISEEWFVKMDDLAKGAIKEIKAGMINFLPKNYSKILVDWLENIHDWCISRSLWWGHRIPVWYPSTSLRTSLSTRSARSLQQSSGQAGQVAGIKVSMESPGPGWIQDDQVLDTWFSSGLWPLSTLGWPHFVLQSRTSRGKPSIALATEGKPSDKKPSLDPDLEKYFPWDFEISAPEIKYLWIARMIMLSVYLTGQIPFKTMFFHGMLRDLQGRKFSKSLGNGIEPAYLINTWGIDATRMTLYSYSVPGRDGRVSKELFDERSKNFRNFATKIKNIAKFVLDLKPENSIQKLEFNHKDDRWIKLQLEKTIKKTTNDLEQVNLHLATEEIYNFVWHEFADIYIEKSKKRRLEAQPVLEYILKNILILLHPFMPFLTEEIYQRFNNKQKSILLDKWPVLNN